MKEIMAYTEKTSTSADRVAVEVGDIYVVISKNKEGNWEKITISSFEGSIYIKPCANNCIEIEKILLPTKRN